MPRRRKGAEFAQFRSSGENLGPELDRGRGPRPQFGNPFLRLGVGADERPTCVHPRRSRLDDAVSSYRGRLIPFLDRAAQPRPRKELAHFRICREKERGNVGRSWAQRRAAGIRASAHETSPHLPSLMLKSLCAFEKQYLHL